uniref:Elongator complex protein 6 n=1 Tax=Meleagris gallopavo TaxID=9103 RepID=A0A803YKR7_MELGA
NKFSLLLLFQGKFTLLRDSRTDGSFLVHHFLSFYLRGGRPTHGLLRFSASKPVQTEI